jgi:YesN/AraC family two-component response regulator
VREATAREHIALSQALREQMEADQLQAEANKSRLIAIIIGVLALLILIGTFVVIFKNRTISRKNRLLAQQIAEAVHYKEIYWEERHEGETVSTDMSNLSSLTDAQLFQYINDVIVREKLFLDSKFERQSIMDRFHLSKERVGAIFSNGSHYSKLSTYLQQLRLEYAAKLLAEQPDKSILQVSEESGFSSNTYFSNCFRQHFSISPSDFRRDATDLLSKQND